MNELRSSKVIVFDGVCVLCSGWVNFVLRRDRTQEFSFAAMQTEKGRALLTQYGIDPDDPVTFLLIEDNTAYTDTDAALRVVGRFGGGWRAFAMVFRCIPRSIRGPCYRWAARNRYRFFGRRETCYLPSTDEAARFLR